ncbi:MAG: amidohydrolase family protein [Chloroflexi bacterium]|nr:amidohydrolase family protein [Chloroflexota bacterium]
MEIIDAQVHLNHIHPEWRTADVVDIFAAARAAMDAVGVDALVVSEYWGPDVRWREELPNGVFRSRYPFSELAATSEPARFVYHTMVNIDDPELDDQVARVRQRSGGAALRIVPIPETGAVDRLRRGDFEPFFAAAERHQVPVFCWMPGRGPLLVPYLKKFPKLQFILDHCGVGQAPYRLGPTAPTLVSSVVATRAERVKQFDSVLELAEYPNLALKWCHAPNLFSEQEFPYCDALPVLRKAIDGFGVDRIMWASDYTQARTEMGITWAQALYYVLQSDQLSEEEKTWLLGGSVRKALHWSA